VLVGAVAAPTGRDGEMLWEEVSAEQDKVCSFEDSFATLGLPATDNRSLPTVSTFVRTVRSRKKRLDPLGSSRFQILVTGASKRASRRGARDCLPPPEG
jgi:hypothetical protein